MCAFSVKRSFGVELLLTHHLKRGNCFSWKQSWKSPRCKGCPDFPHLKRPVLFSFTFSLGTHSRLHLHLSQINFHLHLLWPCLTLFPFFLSLLLDSVLYSCRNIGQEHISYICPNSTTRHSNFQVSCFPLGSIQLAQSGINIFQTPDSNARLWSHCEDHSPDTRGKWHLSEVSRQVDHCILPRVHRQSFQWNRPKVAHSSTKYVFIFSPSLGHIYSCEML